MSVTSLPKLITWAPMGNSHSSATPFGTKVELALRLAGIDYTVAAGDPMDKKTFVKQKFPVLQHGDKLIPDSSQIFAYLQSTYPDKMALFTPSSPQSKTLAHALKRMLEEHSYFGLVYGLWHRDEVSVEYGPQLFRGIPSVKKSGMLRTMIPLIRMQSKGKLLRDLNGQGMGLHSMEEMKERLGQDLDTCAELLEGSGAYLTGETPTEADCFLYGFLDHGLCAGAQLTVEMTHTTLIKDRPPLVAFHERVTAKAFPSGRSDAWDTANQ